MKRKLKIFGLIFAVFFVAGVFFTSCGKKGTSVITGKEDTGQLGVTLRWEGQEKERKFVAPPGITTIRITISAPDMSTITQNFDASLGGGTITDVPAGTNRTISAQGLDSSGVVKYSGSVRGVTIVGGQTTNVTIILFMAVSPEEWNLVYSQDFSSDPNLVTGYSLGAYTNPDTDYFYWDSQNGTLKINQPWSCIDNTVHYAYIDIPDITGAFKLEFDILVEDQVYNNDNGIWLSPINNIPDLVTCEMHWCGCSWNLHSQATINYGYADPGKCFGGGVMFGEIKDDWVWLSAGCSYEDNPIYNAMDGKWRHLILTFDPQNDIVSVEIQYKDTGEVIRQYSKSLGGKTLVEPLRYMYWSRREVCGGGCPDVDNISRSTIDNIKIWTK